MTPEMKRFLVGLADLMDECGVESIEVMSEAAGWNGTVVLGIDVYIPGEWDEEGEPTRQFIEHRLGTWMTSDGVRAQADPTA